MRILIYPGHPSGTNFGDLAMLQAALAQLQELWLGARLQVFTNDAAVLALQCPTVEPIRLCGAKRWFRVGMLPPSLFSELAPEVRAQFPLTWRGSYRLARWLNSADFSPAREFATALFGADLLVLSGCGLLNDEFPGAAMQVLDIFAAAQRCGIPTAMVGQGIGPLRSEPLLRRAAEVLPEVGAIHLRESCFSGPLLEKLGVPAAHSRVTGDDAIGLSFHARRAVSGAGIGVNLRLADYSGIDGGTVETVRQVLAEKSREFQADPVGIPILTGDANPDPRTIARLVGKTETFGNDALPEVIRRVGECRIMVTGSYHAGVFALAQGIPTVAIAQSEYYLNKFEGLAHQFGTGCIVLRADAERFAPNLRSALERAWNDAGVIREKILVSAEAQVLAMRAAYARLPELMIRR